MKLKKLLKWLIPSILLITAIIYRIPVHYQGETTAYMTDDVGSFPIVYDITVRRYLLKPTRVSGEMTIDGKRYGDMELWEEMYFSDGALEFVQKAYDDFGFWENLRRKYGAVDSANIFYGLFLDPNDYVEDIRESMKYQQQQYFSDAASELQAYKTVFHIRGNKMNGFVFGFVEDEESQLNVGYEYTAVLE